MKDALMPAESIYDNILLSSFTYNNGGETSGDMPLVVHLSDRLKDFGWHRNEEWKARGLEPVPKSGTKLEAWERQSKCAAGGQQRM